ncbi:MAG: ThuA domain-containing protein [Oceanipulchritudo sp.]
MKNQPPIRIFAISGSREYRSDESLTFWKRILEESGSYAVTLAEAGERGTTVPGIEQLEDHDILLVFCKRLELSPAELIPIMKWCWKGRPVIGIRTASHAFQTWLDFDHEILGGSYDGHGPAERERLRQPVEKAAGHPVLDGISEWSGPAKTYRNPNLAPECVELIRIPDAGTLQPVAWTRTVPDSRGRVFYTSLGEPEDFAEPVFLRLLRNAVDWVACRSGGYQLRHLSEMETVKCPCGNTRRAFAVPENPLATVHMVDITEDSQSHYHRRLSEIYLIIEGTGFMEVNGERIPVKALDTLFIERGCRHRAVGDLRIVNIPIPSFDPEDEWFD